MSAHTPGPWVFGNWADKKQGEPDGASWVEIWSLQDGEDALPFVACKHQDQLANARLIAAAPELKANAQNYEITGPDDDGLLWLVLHGNGTTGKAMFNLGSADRLAGQVALLHEQDRRAAIAKATPEAKP